jgi:hypothetical protein
MSEATYDYDGTSSDEESTDDEGGNGGNGGNAPVVIQAVQAGEMATNCPLCLAANCDIMLVPCGHLLHWSCMGANSALNVGGSCPLCRGTINDFYSEDNGNWVYYG